MICCYWTTMVYPSGTLLLFKCRTMALVLASHVYMQRDTFTFAQNCVCCIGKFGGLTLPGFFLPGIIHSLFFPGDRAQTVPSPPIKMNTNLHNTTIMSLCPWDKSFLPWLLALSGCHSMPYSGSFTAGTILYSTSLLFQLLHFLFFFWQTYFNLYNGCFLPACFSHHVYM